MDLHRLEGAVETVRSLISDAETNSATLTAGQIKAGDKLDRLCALRLKVDGLATKERNHSLSTSQTASLRDCLEKAIVEQDSLIEDRTAQMKAIDQRRVELEVKRSKLQNQLAAAKACAEEGAALANEIANEIADLEPARALRG